MIIGPLYHWAPKSRRDLIREGGLKPFQMPMVSGGDVQMDGTEPSGGQVRYAYVCLGTDPQLAWRLSGDMDWVREIEHWDLWQVRLDDDDEVHYRSDFGPYLVEVRVYTPIPPDRVWLIGTRDGEHPAALTYPPPGIAFAQKRKAREKAKRKAAAKAKP